MGEYEIKGLEYPVKVARSGQRVRSSGPVEENMTMAAHFRQHPHVLVLGTTRICCTALCLYLGSTSKSRGARPRYATCTQARPFGCSSSHARCCRTRMTCSASLGFKRVRRLAHLSQPQPADVAVNACLKGMELSWVSVEGHTSRRQQL